MDAKFSSARAVGDLGEQIDLPALPFGQVVEQLLVQKGDLSRAEVSDQMPGEVGVEQEQQVGEKDAKQVLPQLVVAGHSGTYLLPLNRRKTTRPTLQFGGRAAYPGTNVEWKHRCCASGNLTRAFGPAATFQASKTPSSVVPLSAS